MFAQIFITKLQLEEQIMKNSKKCKFTAGLDSISLEKAHSAS
jgi:hypothetical protein